MKCSRLFAFATLIVQCALASAQQPISFADIKGVQVGNAQDDVAKTGLTVLWFPNKAMGGVDISGGGPASRETPVIDPERADTPVDACVLAGGSAYGLGAANGVMECLEEHGIGYNVGVAKVPIVVQSDIFDLSYGSAKVRPDIAMGRKATEQALQGTYPISGNVGGGTGATVGKMAGMRQAQKAGIGYAAFQVGDVQVGAVVVVNAVGDVYEKSVKIAGSMNPERTQFLDGMKVVFRELNRDGSPVQKAMSEGARTNTTIGAIVTNANFTKAQLKKIASMARNGFARAINPVGTQGDGDTIYAFSVDKEAKSDVNLVGALAAEAMEAAIIDAVKSAQIPDEEYLKNVR